MRSIGHLAVQNLVVREGDRDGVRGAVRRPDPDCVLRRGRKHRITQTTVQLPMLPEDIALPVQAPADAAAGSLGVILCFGDLVLGGPQRR